MKTTSIMNRCTRLFLITLFVLGIQSRVNAQQNAFGSSGDLENQPEGLLPVAEVQEKFYFEVNPELGADNDFIKVVNTKAHSGRLSLCAKVTPESITKWFAHPFAPDFPESMFLRLIFNPQQVIHLIHPNTVLSFWIFVEKGAFEAQIRLRSFKGRAFYKDIIKADLNITDPDKWVQVKLKGAGEEGITIADLSMELHARGDYVVYMDDFYCGPEEGLPSNP